MRRIGGHSDDVGRDIWPRVVLPAFERVLDDCYTKLHATALAITRQLLLHVSLSQQGEDHISSGSNNSTSNGSTSNGSASGSNHPSTSLSYINSIFECSGSANASQIAQSNLTAPSQTSQSTISGQVSMTNLTAFKYHVPKGEFRSTVHCPHHR